MVGAYVHCRPDGSVFYVGKGTKRRSKFFYNRNPHHSNVVNKYGQKNILIGFLECSSDQVAFELERGIIKGLLRTGIELTNKTNGGEGFTSGNSPWNKGKAGIMPSPWNKGMKMPEDYCKKLSEAHKGQTSWTKGKALTEQHKANLSASRKNRWAWNKGIKMLDETRKKLSDAKKGRILSEEHKAKISAGLQRHYSREYK